MYARIVTSELTDPSRVDEALDIVRNSMLPNARELKGYNGYLLFGDRATGKSIAVTLWETEADREASGQGSDYFQQTMARLASLFKGPPTVQEMEVLVNE